MAEITPLNAHEFLQKYPLTGAYLSRFRIRNRTDRWVEGEVTLRLRQGGDRVRLKLFFRRVEEFRFQRRPNLPLFRLRRINLGFFDDLIYFNFDGFEEDGPPKVMDFRASDCYIAAQTLEWEVDLPAQSSS